MSRLARIRFMGTQLPGDGRASAWTNPLLVGLTRRILTMLVCVRKSARRQPEEISGIVLLSAALREEHEPETAVAFATTRRHPGMVARTFGGTATVWIDSDGVLHSERLGPDVFLGMEAQADIRYG